MAQPDVAVHLVVPGGGRRLLVATRARVPSLPVVTPTLGEDDRLVSALQRHVRAAWQLDPVVLETHLPPQPSTADAWIALAVLDVPPAEWRPPAGLGWTTASPSVPDVVAPRARSWFGELTNELPPPDLRPPWSRPGWMAGATDWIDETLARLGRRRAGPIALARLWSISAMLRIPTDVGDAWFKAVYRHFRHEPAVTALLSATVPDLVPPVLGIEPQHGWLLLDASGRPPSRTIAGDQVVLGAIDQLADVQERTRNLLAEFAAIGCPRRPLARLGDDLAETLRGIEALGGPHVPPGRAAQVVDWVSARAEWVDAMAFDDVLVHGDFHPGNLLVGPRGTRIIDWSDAAIAHPIVEVGPWFGEVRPDVRPRGWQAWLGALSRFGPVEALRGRERQAYAVSCAYQVVSYARILRDIEPANRYQLSDGLNGYWRDLDESVPRRARSRRGIGRAMGVGMNEHEPDRHAIDESSYGGSAAETGGLYDDAGPTAANPEGDTMSEEEERDSRPPEAPAT